MIRPRIFVARQIPEAGLSLLRARCEVEVWPERLPPSPEILRAKLADADGVVSLLTDRIDAALLEAAPKLAVVSNFAVGYNNIDVAACTARGIPVGNTPGVLTEATADIAVSLLLAAGRRLIEGCEDAKAGRWLTWEPCGYLGVDLLGKTLGIVGMGRIGHATARRLHRGWDMRVLYTSPREMPDSEHELSAKRVDLDTLLAESDFVSVHAPLTPQTKLMFGAKEFAKMRRTAVFVNTSRGPLVDQDALYTALKSGTIAFAGLDVTDPEPLPADHPLYTLPNCVIAPHIASATFATRDAVATMAAKNALAGVFGEPLVACVNPEVIARRQKG